MKNILNVSMSGPLTITRTFRAHTQHGPMQYCSLQEQWQLFSSAAIA
nr:MAG TPA: hypothetical protein [Caudoviricetes sp.]